MTPVIASAVFIVTWTAVCLFRWWPPMRRLLPAKWRKP